RRLRRPRGVPGRRPHRGRTARSPRRIGARPDEGAGEALMASSPMRKVALRNLAAHKVRLALTPLSVVLGTAFIAGSFVFTDTLQRTFDGIFADEAKGVDVRVSPEEMQSFGVPLEVVEQVKQTEGVRAVAPAVNGVILLLDPAGEK